MRWRHADPDHDLASLATWNAALIRDEGHGNAMSCAELKGRMRAWLDSTYTAILFENEEGPLGYALFEPHEYGGVHLRQFFIIESHRRRGLGTEAFYTLREDVFPKGAPVVVDVLTLNAGARAFWTTLGFSDYARRLKLGCE